MKIPDDIAAWLAEKLGPLPPRPVEAAMGACDAAVLMPIVDRPGAPTLILTLRADGLSSHASQLSFPGGKIEPRDESPAAAALRETQEEIGLAPEFVRTVGALGPRETGTGFRIFPIVGVVRPGFTLKPDSSEVADVLELPLAALLDESLFTRHRANRNGVERTHYVIESAGQLIWGATAGMIVDLHAQLFGARAGETSLSLARQPWIGEPATRAVMAALQSEGAPARFVGGCVRNALLRAPIADIDIATPEPPARVTALLERAGLKAVPTGLEHGTVTAIAMGKSFEITTLRRDVETFGRHANVAFTTDFAEDAARRDFTINAIYADETGLLYDYVGGMADLLTRRVRFIGEPSARIEEDYLRILRFFRFHAWYGRGAPDPAGLAAAARLKEGLKRLSAERIAHELLRLLEAPDPARALEAMAQSGVLALVLPETGDLTGLKRLQRAETELGLAPDAVLRLATILPALPERAQALAKRLKLPNAMRERLEALAEGAGALQPRLAPAALHAFCYRLGFERLRDLVLLSWARGKDTAFAPQWAVLIEAAQAWPIPVFPLSGADLRAAGMAEGPALGRLLGELEAEWVGEDFKADKATLLARLEKRMRPRG